MALGCAIFLELHAGWNHPARTWKGFDESHENDGKTGFGRDALRFLCSATSNLKEGRGAACPGIFFFPGGFRLCLEPSDRRLISLR